MDIYHLVYRSKAIDASEQALKDILKVSRLRNAEDLVTGFLIYRDNYFMQLLEGPEKKVKATLDRIRADRRNTDVTVLGELVSAERMNPNWSMVLVKPDQVKISSESFIDLFDLGTEDDVFRDKMALETMLRLFSKNAEFVETEA